MFEQVRQDPARNIAESDAVLREVGRQAKDDDARDEEQVRMREMQIRDLHRVLQAADKNAYESENAARLATPE